MEIQPSRFRKFLWVVSAIIAILAVVAMVCVMIIGACNLYAAPGSVFIDNADFSIFVNGFSFLFLLSISLVIGGFAAGVIGSIWLVYWLIYFAYHWVKNSHWFFDDDMS